MKKIIGAFLFMLVAVLLSCAQNAVHEKPEPGKWSGKMHELSQVMSSLYPYLWSREDFYNEKNYADLESKVKRFSELAHSINSKSISESPDADPAIKFLAKDFDNDISRAYDALRNGSKEYSRQVLAVAANHCISCHSRNEMGPKFEALSLNFDFEKLNPFVRAEAYMATRQFQKAADEFTRVTVRKDYVLNYPFEVERALKKGLAIHIRVNNDVNSAIKFVNNFLSQSEIPMFLEKQAKSWKQELMDWKKEGSGVLISKSSYLKKLDELTNRPPSENSFISFLRASALGHYYLSKYKNDATIPDVLFKMGLCYESLEDLGYWTLADNYYTQCIREKPHSPIAVKCLSRYEQNIYLGYTGSSGTNLPPEVRAQLRELKELAL